MKTHTLVLLRHGESIWNQENRFTGWVDVDLSPRGREEAAAAGQLVAAERLEFDCVYTSVLKRAIRTLWYVLDATDQMWLPVHRDWRLNERHYGALQGLNKSEMVKKYGEAQVHEWRRSFDIPPPRLPDADPGHPRLDRRYATIDPKLLPSSEALKQTAARFSPLWTEEIAPKIRAGKRVLIVAHGNSLRALVKRLDKIGDAEIASRNIPTGIPLVYELDENLDPISSRYLGDPEAAKAAEEKVKNQSRQGL